MKDTQEPCLRCGQCCQHIELAESPETLKKAFEAFQQTGEEDPRFSEIEKIFSMLEFVKMSDSDPLQPYVYRCRHFSFDENKLGTCAIHAERPYMCEGFPYYEKYGQSVREDGPPSHYKDCGYNS